MARRRPARPRPSRRPRRTSTRGLPGRTVEALDRLEIDDLSAVSVALALQEWAEVVGQPERVLSAPHND